MNRSTGFITIATVAALAGASYADGVVNMTGAFPGYDGGNGGGTFTATSVSGYNGESFGPGSTANSFQTFCLQENEFVNPFGSGTNYNTVIAGYTVLAGRSNYDPSTGAAATASGIDELSSTTALLYSTFRSSNDFSFLGAAAPASTSALAGALQLAIWYSEGELSDGTGATFDNYTAYTGNLTAVAMFNWAMGANNGSFYNVRVLQMFDRDSNGNSTGNAQDMLTIVPLPPAAYAGMGTLAGVIGMGYIRRRRLANA